MENQIPEEIKHKRFDRLKLLVESQITENNSKYIGTIQKVLVEGTSKTNDKMLTRKNRNKQSNCILRRKRANKQNNRGKDNPRLFMVSKRRNQIKRGSIKICQNIHP